MLFRLSRSLLHRRPVSVVVIAHLGGCFLGRLRGFGVQPLGQTGLLWVVRSVDVESLLLLQRLPLPGWRVPPFVVNVDVREVGRCALMLIFARS